MRLRKADLVNLAVIAASGLVVFTVVHATGLGLLEALVALLYLVLLAWQLRRAVRRARHDSPGRRWRA